jgi:glutathione S-transferase
MLHICRAILQHCLLLIEMKRAILTSRSIERGACVMKQFEIVSHPLCPFAQRLVLAALASGLKRDVDFKVTYLDLPTMKDTVRAYSPTGEVPALMVDGQCVTTTTEHAAEYINQIGSKALLPETPDQRLAVRRREQKARATLDALRGVFMSKTADSLKATLETLFGQLQQIDDDLAADGTDETVIRMDMVALAPVFSLANFHQPLRDHPLWKTIPRLRDIGRKLAENEIVKSSRCPNYGGEFATFFKFTGSAFTQLIATSH